MYDKETQTDDATELVTPRGHRRRGSASVDFTHGMESVARKRGLDCVNECVCCFAVEQRDE